MSNGLVIVVPLQSSDWRPPSPDGGKGEWFCRALALPTARFRSIRRADGTVVSPEAFSVRRNRIVWKGGMRPAVGLQVELELRRSLHSRAALVGSLLLGLAGGFWLHLHQETVAVHLDNLLRMLPV